MLTANAERSALADMTIIWAMLVTGEYYRGNRSAPMLKAV